MSDLYYLCHDIAIYDLKNSTVEGVKSSLSDQPMGVGVKRESMSSVIHAWTERFCYPQDRERFTRFMDVSTLRSRMEHSPDGTLTGMFRSMTAEGEYRWFFHIIAPMQRSDFDRALHVTFETGLKESEHSASEIFGGGGQSDDVEGGRTNEWETLT